jgi:hypothetical protein
MQFAFGSCHSVSMFFNGLMQFAFTPSPRDPGRVSDACPGPAGIRMSFQ